MADAPAPSVPTNPSDPTPYIRTYAKDVARLTGTKQIAPAHAGPQKEGPEAGVLMPDFDPTQSQGVRGEGSSPREFAQEVISVTSADTVANINANPVSREVNRDEILTRLRERVRKEIPQPEPVIPASPAPAPAPIALSTAIPAPLQPPRPAPAPQAFSMPPVSPSPTSVPAPSAPVPQVPDAPPEPLAHEAHAFPFFSHHAPKTKLSDPTPSNLHTFKSDFADHIDEQKASTFSVLAAQGDSRDARIEKPKQAVFVSKKSRLPVLLGGIALVVVGIGLIGGAYWFVALRLPSAGVPFSVPSLIFADENVEISGTGPQLAQAVNEVAHQTSVNGNIIVTYVTATSDGKKGIIKTAQPGGPIIKQMFASAPDILLRNITDASTVGVIDAANTSAPFFILDVSSYERTFAGMLGWEPTLADDLAILYPPYPDASQDPGTAARIVSPPRFVDATVANHDVRMLRDSAGRTILIYGYRDKQTLIIARDEAAFTAILSRLSSGNSR